MSITCSNCGKDIPYHGNVCPYCNADKNADKKAFDKTFSFVGSAFFGAIIGGFIGYQIKPGMLCLGSVIGPAVGLIICYFFLHSQQP